MYVYCIRAFMVKKKIIARYASSRFDDRIIREKENDNQVSEKVSSATLPSHLFIVIEINKRRMMIDSGHRRQIRNAHKNK
jgi:hypothetical protein